MSGINKYLNSRFPDNNKKLQPSQISDKKIITTLMDLWNNHPACSSQISHPPRHIKTNTKVYKKSTKHLSELLSGKFKNNKTFSVNQLGRLPNLTKLSKKKYLPSTLKIIIRKLGYLYDDNYLPKDKRRLPKNFPDLLYNPRTGYSHFLEIAAKSRISRKDLPPVFDKNLLNIMPIQITKLADEQQKRFLSGIKTIELFYKQIPNGTTGRIRYHLPDFISLLKEYISFLDKPEYWNFNIHDRKWEKFVIYLEAKFGVGLKP